MALKSSRDDNYLKQPFCRGSRHISPRDEGVRGWRGQRVLATKKAMIHGFAVANLSLAIHWSSQKINYSELGNSYLVTGWRELLWPIRKTEPPTMEDGNLFILKGCCVDKDHSSIFQEMCHNDCRQTILKPAKKSNIISILFGNSFLFAIKNREKKRREEKDDKKRQRGRDAVLISIFNE